MWILFLILMTGISQAEAIYTKVPGGVMITEPAVIPIEELTDRKKSIEKQITMKESEINNLKIILIKINNTIDVYNEQ